MSAGLTPAEFVQQVYYCQEKVLLDFEPHNDKYKEVLMEANLVLQELEVAEDWLWLRETKVLGETGDYEDVYDTQLSFAVPDDVLKPSRLYGDSIRLHWYHTDDDDNKVPCELRYMRVPWLSAGYQHNTYTQQILHGMPDINTGVIPLGAVLRGDTVQFTRPLIYRECDKVVCSEWQVPITKFDLDAETDDTYHYETKLLTEIPNPNYVVWATAARHAVGSPPAAHLALELDQKAQRILSSMRQDNAEATMPDYVEREHPWVWEVV